MHLDLAPFEHPMVNELLGSASSKSGSPSFFRRIIPQEPDTWILLLKPPAELDPLSRLGAHPRPPQ